VLKALILALLITPVTAVTVPTIAAEAAPANIRVVVAAPRNTPRVRVARVAVRPALRRPVTVAAVPLAVGTTISLLPRGYHTIAWRGRTYYVHGNTLYRPARGGFVVARRPARMPAAIIRIGG